MKKSGFQHLNLKSLEVITPVLTEETAEETGNQGFFPGTLRELRLQSKLIPEISGDKSIRKVEDGICVSGTEIPGALNCEELLGANSGLSRATVFRPSPQLSWAAILGPLQTLSQR